MKIKLTERATAALKRGDMAIMKLSGTTRVILIEKIQGDEFTGTTLYFNSSLTDSGSGTTHVGDYSEGWQLNLFTPFTGTLEMTV